jgi:tetratricopeptide (TPR) repeat protein
MALCALGSYAEALEHHHRASSILTASKGAEHHDALTARLYIADVLYEQGHAAQAVEELRAAIEVLERTHGPALMIGDALVQLGLALLETDDVAGARAQLERALPLFAEADGGGDRATAQFALAQVLWVDGERAQARTLAVQAREGYRAAGEFGKRDLAKLEAWLREHP